MKTQLLEQEIKYEGWQLSPHWIYKNFKMQGDATVAFIGECEVKLTEMVDIEDVINNEPIYSKSMLSFISEQFNIGLVEGVFRQRLLICVIKEALENYHENGLAVLETAEAIVLADGSCAQQDTIYISTDEDVSINIENEYTDLFEVIAPLEAEKGTFEVVINAIQDPEPSGATEYDFIIKLYSQVTNEMVKKVTCTVTFQAPSSTPED